MVLTFETAFGELRGPAAIHDHGARGQVAEALAALAGDHHGDEAHEVEADSVDDAKERASHDLALAGLSPALALDTKAEQPLAEGLSALGLRGVVVEERPADDDHGQKAGQAATGGKNDHCPSSAHDGQIHCTGGRAAVVETRP